MEVYDSDSKTTKVAESQGAVTENITNLTVEWDTSDVIPGTYTVQYYVANEWKDGLLLSV